MAEYDGRIFFADMEKDELRAGFLVTGRRKRIWNAELNLLAEFASICQRHGLRWQMGYGTLLGAARRGGFIPWDDDVDLTVPRADYERLQDIMAGLQEYQDCRGKFFSRPAIRTARIILLQNCVIAGLRQSAGSADRRGYAKGYGLTFSPWILFRMELRGWIVYGIYSAG